MQRRNGLSFGMLLVVLCGAATVGVGGCGSDSGGANEGPAARFLGRWELDGTSSTFTLGCQTAGNLTNFPIWAEMLFERGVLTDASEASAVCFQPGLSFDVDSKKTMLSLVTPDPYRMAPNDQPSCDSSLGTDSSGNRLFLLLTFQSASFTLLQQTPGTAPTALFAATGSGDVVSVDTTGAASTADTCTYTGTGDTFHQMTKL